MHDRSWICPKCGNEHDRDLNAALNIRDEGERIIGSRTTEFTLVEIGSVDDRLGNKALKSTQSMKQEDETDIKLVIY